MNFQLLIFMIKHPEFSDVDTAKIFSGAPGSSYKNVNKLRRHLRTAEHQLYLKLRKTIVAHEETSPRERPEPADEHLPPGGDSTVEAPSNSERNTK